MANADHIALIIQAIRGESEYLGQERVGFNMASYVCNAGVDLEDKSKRDCGTIACIAGHAYLLATSNEAEQAMGEDPDEIEAVAAGFIGLSDDEAAHLFYDLPAGHQLKDVTAEQAIETLTRLAQSGAVQWNL